MSEIITEFNEILTKEDNLLDSLIVQQAELRKNVTEKNWTKLISTITEINRISEDFQIQDKRRDEIQIELTTQELQPSFEKLGQVRSKLLKCKIENRVLGDYVNIAKNFIAEVMDKAMPARSAKNYTRTGTFAQPQMQSVVLNQIF